MSDPNYLQVDFGAMEELCTTLGQLEQQAQTAMNDMTKVVDTNLAAWNGQARTMYEHSRANWDKVFASLTATLAKAQQHVLTTNEIYQQTEVDNAKLFH